jgi:hypothetical protein
MPQTVIDGESVAVELYLDLLKKSLTRCIAPEDYEAFEAPRGTRGPVAYWKPGSIVG